MHTLFRAFESSHSGVKTQVIEEDTRLAHVTLNELLRYYYQHAGEYQTAQKMGSALKRKRAKLEEEKESTSATHDRGKYETILAMIEAVDKALSNIKS